MNIFAIVLELYVNLNKNFQDWIKPLILHDFYWSTIETIMFSEACLLTGTSHES